MSQLKLEICQKIADAALASARELKLKPICVMILDARASLRLCVNQDGTSIHRHRIAHGKANAALSLGMGSRALGDRAEVQAYFIDAVGRMMGGDFIPVPGGVLMKDSEGTILGAVGISGDLSDNDEKAAVAGIEAAGLIADTGAYYWRKRSVYRECKLACHSGVIFASNRVKMVRFFWLCLWPEKRMPKMEMGLL